MATPTRNTVRRKLGLGNTIAQQLAEYPTTVTFSPAAGSSNVCNVTLTVKDSSGTAVGPTQLMVHLSDAATGLGVTGTSASGTVTNASGGGTVLAAVTAKKVLLVQTKADGTFVLEITDTAKTGFYVSAQLPSGKLVTSDQLITANYG